MKKNGRIIIRINDSNDARHFLYAYAETVKKMFEIINRGLRNHNDNYKTYLIPTLYLMRHSLEIGLKILIKNIDPSFKFPNNATKAHDVDFLYQTLIQMGLDLDSKYPSIKTLCKGITKIDKDGTFFKYTYNRKGKKTISNVDVHFSILYEVYKNFIKEYVKLVNDNYPEIWDTSHEFIGI